MAGMGNYLGPLAPDKMTDAGMWWWSAIITVGILAVAFFVAIGWQRWKDKKKA